MRKRRDYDNLIAEGWEVIKSQAMPPDIKGMQLEAMKMLYYTGARHLLTNIICIPFEDRQAVSDRVMALSAELDRYNEETDKLFGKPGHA